MQEKEKKNADQPENQITNEPKMSIKPA